MTEEKTENWRDKNPIACEDLPEDVQESVGCTCTDEEIAKRPPTYTGYLDEVEGKIYLLDKRKIHHIQKAPPEIRRNVKPVEPLKRLQKRELEV